jgi:SAM-dependent MidA family methyltransferase
MTYFSQPTLDSPGQTDILSSSPLSALLIQKIKSEGPISFHDYMELSLYHPEHGYYTSVQDKIGPGGDFYTSSNVSHAFGAMLGRQFREMWKNLGGEEFTIVEYGAGTGMLCHDILNYLSADPEFYEKIRYSIIEKSSAMREKEQKLLPSKVLWMDKISDLGNINGCVFSNELLDNFAIHKVLMKDQLMEVYVGYDEGFYEVLKPASKQLVNYFEELNVVLPEGFCTEVNLEAIEWIKEISENLTKGYLLTIDYGFPSGELYADRRRNGTLLCYQKHEINDRPYFQPGKQDITSHVNFSALQHWGNKYGLTTCGFTNQAHFLGGLGWEEYAMEDLLKGKGNYLDLRKYSLLKYTMMVDMGHKFKVLIQRKGVDDHKLSGIPGETV